MGTLGEIFKLVKEELKKTKDTVAEQAPVVKGVLSEEAKVIGAAAKEKGAEAKVVIKGSYLGATKAIKEQMPVVKESLKEGAAEVKNFFSMKTEENTDAAENAEGSDFEVDPAAEAENEEGVISGNVERVVPAGTGEDSDKLKNLSKLDTRFAGDVADPCEDILDDISFIRDMKHNPTEGWNQYDFLLAAAPYGWDYILDSADYMVTADLGKIGTISLGRSLGGNPVELISDYKAGAPISSVKTLAIEGSTLGVGGISAVLKCPVKIVWINQTNTLRIFTLGLSDNMLLKKYAETVIRRTFGTENAMKMAKPCDQI